MKPPEKRTTCPKCGAVSLVFYSKTGERFECIIHKVSKCRGLG